MKVEQPFYADFWERISVGENFYSNYNFKVLAGNQIEIGDNVLFKPEDDDKYREGFKCF